ncbi:Nonribosomal peptide synthase nlsA [Trichinella spiralis]|uniref:Nonribosomal peptide synthase nlsA n=1 Tax=Trichinella spiralis TaxID=6334 RepID=A0ABR3L2E6_TRISP
MSFTLSSFHLRDRRLRRLVRWVNLLLLDLLADLRDDERLHAATHHRLVRITVGPQSNVNPPQSTLSERSALKKLSQAAAAYLPWQNGQPLVTDTAATDNVMWPPLFHFGRGDFFEDVLYSVLLSDSLTPSSTGVESESFGRTPVTSSNCGPLLIQTPP